MQNTSLNIGAAGLSLIREFESCKLDAYIDCAGVLTIGYGSTRDVYDGMRITFDEAIRRLQEDLAPVEAEIAKLVRVPLTQCQFDALACLAFNIGVGAFARSTLLRMLSLGEYARAADQFLAWNKIHGTECAGLTRRREAERALFLS